MTESFGKSGKIANTYREASRWISVKNISDVEIPSFSPCRIYLGPKGSEFRDEKKMLAVPFVSSYPDSSPVTTAAWFRRNSVRIAFTGGSPIKAGGTGSITVDYPVVCRVDPELDAMNFRRGLVDRNPDLYIDVVAPKRGLAVNQLSTLGLAAFDLRPSDEALYEALMVKFGYIAVANEEASLYWIMPASGTSRTSLDIHEYTAYLDSQDLVATLPMAARSVDNYGYEDGTDWGGVDSDGAIVFNRPGIFLLNFELTVSGSSDDGQDEATLLEQSVNVHIESLSDQYVLPEESLVGLADPLVAGMGHFSQPSYVRSLDCSGGYGGCPKLNVYREGKSAWFSVGLRVDVTDKWKVPRADKNGLRKYTPLVRVKCERTASFYHTQTITAMTANGWIQRLGYGHAFRVYGIYLDGTGFFYVNSSLGRAYDRNSGSLFGAQFV